jgi:hypothetical protein
MAKNDKPGIDIGMEYLRNIYTNTNIETKEAQPIYILYRDTIRTFLHETIQTMGLQGRLLGLIGIELTIVASLVTATFTDWQGIKGSLIQGTFLALAIILGILIVKDIVLWLITRKKCNVNDLVDELATRGSVIKANAEKDTNSG